MWIYLRELMIRGLQGIYDILNYPQNPREKKRLAELRAQKKQDREKRDELWAQEEEKTRERIRARENEIRIEKMSKLLDCPHCGAKCQRKSEAKNDASGCFIVIVGLIFTPLLIGIPIVIYGLVHGSKKAYFWVCSRCRSKFPCD